jgi:hypothetical protein
LQQLRIIPKQQLIELIDDPPKVFADILLGSGKFPETKDVRMLHGDPPKTVLVGP